MNDTDNSALISAAEAARYLRVSRSLLYHLWSRGEGPRSVTLSRRRLTRIEWIEQWLQDKTNKEVING